MKLSTQRLTSFFTLLCVLITVNCNTKGLNTSCGVITTNQTCYHVEKGKMLQINFKLTLTKACAKTDYIVVKRVMRTAQSEPKESDYCQLFNAKNTTTGGSNCYGNETTLEYTVDAVAGDEGEEMWIVRVTFDDNGYIDKNITVHVSGSRNCSTAIQPVSHMDKVTGRPTPSGFALDTSHKVLIGAVVILIFVTIAVYCWGRRKSLQSTADLEIADGDVKGLQIVTNGCSTGPTGVQNDVIDEHDRSDFYRPYSNDARGSVGTYAEVGLDSDPQDSIDHCARAPPASHKGREREPYDHLNSTAFAKQPQNIKQIKTGTGRNLYSSFKEVAKGYKL